ncbi:MAG: hypothetical protein KDA85_10845 [Planctomycetaceae bacterium]|nr:hypothetical protein [Planctomycetaceae bacterium]
MSADQEIASNSGFRHSIQMRFIRVFRLFRGTVAFAARTISCMIVVTATTSLVILCTRRGVPAGSVWCLIST